MGMPGYAGNILYLDLTSGGIGKEPLMLNWRKPLSVARG